MVTKSRVRKSRGSRKRFIGKPTGQVQERVQAVSRHRQNLVKQRARLMVQLRRLLHQTMPGFADLFDEGKLLAR